MQQRLRGWLIRVAWGGLIAASALWFGLLLGRPLYYSDGGRDVAALELADAGMWVWPSPEPVCELPGPLQGRAAALPDGRLLYGRTTENGDTDLVLFDPAHPAAQPEPAAALNSRGHDLAPAVAADGTVWFASDRAGGAGGFDLYRSRSLGHTWTPPEPMAACNTMFDETDAAPSPIDGGTVFVRIDRQWKGGDDGVLYHYAGGEFEPEPLFGAPGRSRPVDRDPVFSRDGAALWFLRQEGPRGRIVRSARLGAVFDAPLPVDRFWGTGALRSPLPVERDRLLLLRPAHGEFGDLLLSSRGREVLPWWHGQRWLEQLLLACIVAAVLLLLLLYLGRRWRSLDLVTLCLLLSLLLHLLLWLWLMGVEIAGSLLPGDDDSGTVQVTLVDSSSGGSPAAGTSGDVARTAQFAPTPSAMQADAPGTAVAAAAASVAASTATWSGTGSAETETERTAELRDAAAAALARDGADAASDVSAAELAAVAPKQAAAAAARAAETGQAFRVAVPESGLGAAASGAVGATGRTVAAPAAAPAELPEPAPAAAAAAALRDSAALAGSPAKSQRDALGASAQPAGELAAPATSDAAATERDAAAAGATTEVHGPEAQLAPARSAAVAQAGRGTLPEPRPSVAGVAEATLRDAAVASAPTSTPTGDAGENDAEKDKAAKKAGGATGVLLAAAAASVPEAGTAGAAAPRRGTAEAAAASAADAKPGSALPQGPAAAGLARSDSARPLPSSSRGSAPKASLRDAPPAPRDAAGGLAAAAPLAATPGAAPDSTPGATTPAAASGAPAPGATTGTGLQASPLPPLPGASGASTAAAAARAGGNTGRPEAAAPPRAGVEAPERAEGLASAGPQLLLPRARVGGSPAPQVRAPEPVASGPIAAGTAAPPAARLQPARDLPAFDGSGGARERAPTRRAAAGSFQPAAAVPPGSLLERPRAMHAGSSAAFTALASPYSNRFGPQKQKALEQFGGSDETERAVRDGLRYLARIQRLDGGWGDPEDYDDKYGFVRIGKTGLCLLAFLGAGHTQKSASEHSAVVRRAVDYLVSLQQSETGAFGVSSAYGHGIATYALAECYGLTKDAALRPRVEEGLSWILQHQGPRRDRRNEGGWGYFSPGLAPEDDYARTSITAWMVMALESARMSGIELPDEVLPASRRFLELAWDQQNRFFRYNHKRSRLESGWPTLPASTPAAAFCLMLLGEPADGDRLRAAIGYTVDRRPQQFRRYDDDAFVLRGQGNVYFWYYGTLCCFLAGGDAWKQWNERLSRVLPAAQARDGSWPPIDPYAITAGDTEQDRAYTTSMCVLSLEIYYRYFTPLLLGR